MVITAGTSSALLLVVYVLLEYSGNRRILTANPGYACYPNFITFLSGEAANYELLSKNRFRINLPQLAPLGWEGAALILVNSPKNPLSTLFTGEEMVGLASLGIPVISDEIYHGMVYKGKQLDTMLASTDNAIILNGFSKLYAMTGWRMGYLIVPDRYIDLTHKLEQNLFILANTIAQYIAIAALTDPSVDRDVSWMIDEYGERREFAIELLSVYGLKAACEPAGTYYIILNLLDDTADSLAFSYKLRHNTKVAVTSGIDYGGNLEGHLLLNYGVFPPVFKEGIERISRYLYKLDKKGRNPCQ